MTKIDVSRRLYDRLNTRAGVEGISVQDLIEQLVTDQGGSEAASVVDLSERAAGVQLETEVINNTASDLGLEDALPEYVSNARVTHANLIPGEADWQSQQSYDDTTELGEVTVRVELSWEGTAEFQTTAMVRFNVRVNSTTQEVDSIDFTGAETLDE